MALDSKQKRGSTANLGAPWRSWAAEPDGTVDVTARASIVHLSSASFVVIVSGALAATETGSDVFASAGDVVVTGSMAATETGADVFAGSGAGMATGSLAATETGADTFTAAGDVIVTGSLAATETGADVFLGSGGAVAVGTMAATEAGADTFAATGQIVVSGVVAATETNVDTAIGAGKVLVIGSAALAEGADTFSAAGRVIVSGAMAATETGADVFYAPLLPLFDSNPRYLSIAAARLLQFVFWVSSYHELNDKYSEDHSRKYPGHLVVASQVVNLIVLGNFIMPHMGTARRHHLRL